MPTVNPEILVWARETAGLTPEEAVKKLSIRDTKKASAVERLAGYESGAEDPSRPVLVKMSKQYRRPLVTFYLPKAPAKGYRGADFRTLPVGTHSPVMDAVLDALIRDIESRQGLVRAILADHDEISPLYFVGSRKISDGHDAVLNSLREILNVQLADYRSQRSPEAAFAFIRDRAERAGIFVILKGDLGSYHTAIDLEAFRGFSIADDLAPFIVINDRDARTAWTFTLLHEMVHLILGQTGVSGRWSENETERFCDDVAGNYLLPDNEADQIGLMNVSDFANTAQLITEFANKNHLSRTMVAYKAYRAGTIGPERYRELSNVFRQQWLQQRAAQNEQREPMSSGPDYYTVRRHRLGRGLTSFVNQMIEGGELSTTKAAKILGVRPSQVQPVLAASNTA